MSACRATGSPGGSYRDAEDEEINSAYRSSFIPSSSASASRRAAPPAHFDDANLYQGSDVDSAANFKVFIRVRPPVARELNGYRRFVDVVQLSKESPGTVTLCDAVEAEDRDGAPAGLVVYSRQSFTFDYVHGPSATQDQVYDHSARPAVLSVLEGYNATLMAYGQTGAGKTYTMEGFTNEEERGIIPRSVEEVFDAIRAGRTDGQTKFLVRASYMQIYNEVISDLLVAPGTAAATSGSNGRPMTVRHTPQRGVYIDGLSEWIVRSPRDVYTLIERGTSNRATSTTKMSELSSRSHAIFTIVVEVLEGDEEAPVSYRVGKLNIVDLAGSEKVRQSGVSGQRLEETKKINRSLHELGNVISALATKSSGGRARHIPFRNSVLTSALRDSLGGNCKTTLIACISPALESYTESLSTLMFANRAKNIKTTAVVNEDMDQAMLLRKYERELKQLRELLAEQQQLNNTLVNSGGAMPSGGGGDLSIVSELEEGRTRAEEGREAALAALQQSAKTCSALESRIRELESVVSEGGFAGTLRTSDEYASRLQELNRERLIMVEDKAQVDRYKQLLLKQRDIMLNLTTRLNERDETILQLQEEIDAYDAHVEKLEDQIADILEGEPGSITSRSMAAAVPGLNHDHRERNSADVRQSAAADMTRAEAEAYLRQCRVPGSGPARYRSESPSGAALTAEEKLLEVLQARRGSASTSHCGAFGSRGRESSPPLGSLAPLSAEEMAKLIAYVRRRSEAAPASARLAALQADVDVMALQLAASEGRAQLYQRVLSLSGGDTASVVKEAAAAVEREFTHRVQTLVDQIDREKNERCRLLHEVDRLRFEVEQQLEAARVTPAQRAAASRLWQGLQAVEQELSEQLDNGGKSSGGSAGGVDRDAAKARAAKALAEAVAAKDRSWRLLLEERQATIDRLLRTSGGNAVAPDTVAPDIDALAAKDAEIASLQRELSIQKKDRRALRTILDQRMKGKVDHIYAVAQQGGDVSALAAEAKSLQTLLNASIKAMDS